MLGAHQQLQQLLQLNRLSPTNKRILKAVLMLPGARRVRFIALNFKKFRAALRMRASSPPSPSR